MLEHEKWLSISKEDLGAAKDLFKTERFSPLVYHCQQSAEKSLKAYLIFKGHPIIKTHDLLRLLELCILSDQSFRKKLEAADFLNPFATKFRYPTEFDIPDKADAEQAIKHANSIMRFVLKKTSIPEAGQSNVFERK